MISEDTSISSFIDKNYLKQKYFNEEFSLLITSIDEEAFNNC